MTLRPNRDSLRAALLIIPLACLCVACPPPPPPATVLTGTLTGDVNDPGDIEITGGTTVTWQGKRRIEAGGDIIIHGRLEGASGSGDDLDLVSRNGSILITGSVEAAAGQDGQMASDQCPTATGGIATAGGDITIAAVAGRITIQGGVIAGRGGHGGQARTGVCATNGIAAATSPSGQSGGNVSLTAGALGVIGGPNAIIRAGNGGNATQAIAQCDAAFASCRAEARVGGGGPGGRVTITVPPAAPLNLAGTNVRSGAGGAVRAAEATGNANAVATTLSGGPAGDIVLSKAPAPPGNLVLGKGGDLNPRAGLSASARTNTGNADASSDQGGNYGSARVAGTVTAEGVGGDGGGTRARIPDPPCDRSDPGTRGTQGGRGTAGARQVCP